MIEPYFNDSDKADALRAEGQSWFGTPFCEYARAKGAHGGIDCVGFCEETTAAAGLERWAIERSGEDYSRHVHNDRVLNYLRGKAEDPASRTIAARWHELPVKEHDFTEPPMVGDLVIYKDAGRKGRGVFHIGLMMNDIIFMHCAPEVGVIEAQIHDTFYSGRLVAHFRARAVPDSIASYGSVESLWPS